MRTTAALYLLSGVIKTHDGGVGFSLPRSGVFVPGFSLWKFEDGRSLHVPSDSTRTWVRYYVTKDTYRLWCLGREIEQFEVYKSPPAPEGVRRYQHTYGWEEPLNLGAWGWSTTFGEWGRTVTFRDGTTTHTWPHRDEARDVHAKMLLALREERDGLYASLVGGTKEVPVSEEDEKDWAAYEVQKQMRPSMESIY